MFQSHNSCRKLLTQGEGRLPEVITQDYSISKTTTTWILGHSESCTKLCYPKLCITFNPANQVRHSGETNCTFASSRSRSKRHLDMSHLFFFKPGSIQLRSKHGEYQHSFTTLSGMWDQATVSPCREGCDICPIQQTKRAELQRIFNAELFECNRNCGFRHTESVKTLQSSEFETMPPMHLPEPPIPEHM